MHTGIGAQYAGLRQLGHQLRTLADKMSTSCGVTCMLEICSLLIGVKVAPISDIVSSGTNMSTSASLRQRIFTLLLLW